MSRPITGTNKYPFGECGFVVDGALLRDGTKLRNLRIYKQRSDVMYDLVDPSTDKIYPKMLITGYSKTGYILNYASSNDQILNEIQPNTFFVRGYNDNMTRQGFIVKFLYNKVVLSSSRPIFDVYTPECHIPLPVLVNVNIDTVRDGDTEIVGKILTPGLISTGMIVVAVINGIEYSSEVDTLGSFTIPVDALSTGEIIDITIKSDYYQEYNTELTVQESDVDSDYATSFVVYPVLNELTGQYQASVDSSSINRGSYLVVQAFQNGTLIYPEISVQSGGINIITNSADAIELVIIGETTNTVPYHSELVFSLGDDGNYHSVITKAMHQKENISYSIYEDGNQIVMDVVIDDDENLSIVVSAETYNELSSTVIVITGK